MNTQDTFRGRVCECPLVDGVQFKGDGYTTCEGKETSSFLFVLKRIQTFPQKKKNSNLTREDKSEGIDFFELLKRFDQHVVCNDRDRVHIYTLPCKCFL